MCVIFNPTEKCDNKSKKDFMERILFKGLIFIFKKKKSVLERKLNICAVWYFHFCVFRFPESMVSFKYSEKGKEVCVGGVSTDILNVNKIL